MTMGELQGSEGSSLGAAGSSPFPGYTWHDLAQRWRLFDRPIESLGLPTRARNAARNMGWARVGDVAIARPDEILRAFNLGRHTREQIVGALHGVGLKLGEDPMGWPGAPPELPLIPERCEHLKDALRLQKILAKPDWSDNDRR